MLLCPWGAQPVPLSFGEPQPWWGPTLNLWCCPALPMCAVSRCAVPCCALCPPNRQGFSGQLFPLYYDSRSWNPYKKADQVAIEFDGLNSSAPSSIYIAFPAMRKLAQDHFGCPSLPGTPADVGSFASHFKQRLMGVSVSIHLGCRRASTHNCCSRVCRGGQQESHCLAAEQLSRLVAV